MQEVPAMTHMLQHSVMQQQQQQIQQQPQQQTVLNMTHYKLHQNLLGFPSISQISEKFPLSI